MKVASKEKFDFKAFVKNFGIVFVLIVMFVAASIIDEAFLTQGNIVNVLRQIAVNGIVAIGMTFVIISGGIDLSVGSTLALTGMMVVLFQQKFNMNPVLAILIVLVVGILIGFINGYSVYRGMPPFIMTLAMQTSLRGAAYITNNGQPVVSMNASYNKIGQGYVFGIHWLPWPVVISLSLFVVAWFVLKYTTFGRKVFAVGGNTEAARLAGINVLGMRLAVFAISGFMSAVASVVLTARIASCDPTLGDNYHSDAIAAVVIGGTAMSGGEGHVIKTLIGALILGVMSNILNLMNVSSYMQQIVKGIIIFAAVASDTWRKKKQ